MQRPHLSAAFLKMIPLSYDARPLNNVIGRRKNANQSFHCSSMTFFNLPHADGDSVAWRGGDLDCAGVKHFIKKGGPHLRRLEALKSKLMGGT